MIQSEPTPFEALSPEAMLTVNRICNEFESRWQAGKRPDLAELIERCDSELRFALTQELIPIDIEYRRKAGDVVNESDYAQWLSAPELKRLEQAFDVSLDTDHPLQETTFEPPVPENLGDYAIKRRIGCGGMGTVYEATHTRMGRSVALKILGRDVWRNSHAQARFLREIRTAAQLSHPNIVTAHDARQHEDIVYLVIEYVAGDDLQRTVRRDGPLELEMALDCLIQAARGLRYAHQQGIIHRDIKPANLIRDDKGVIKILDLGLARAIASDDVDLTGAGTMMGTAAYMAPEQAADLQSADHRADIYSLGCTMYFLLTGEMMYQGSNSVECMLAHAQHPIPSLSGKRPELPQAVEGFFRRMVAKDPAERPQSMDEVIAALDRINAKASCGPIEQSTKETRPEHPAEDRKHLLTVVPPGTGSWPKESLRDVAIVFGAGLIAAMLFVTAFVYAGPDKRVQENDGVHWAIGFDGQQSYVRLPDPGAMPPEITLEAVVTLRTGKIGNIVSWFRGEESVGLGISLDGHWWAGKRMRSTEGASLWQENVSVHGLQPAKLNERQHIAVTFSGSDIQLFVDGVPEDITHLSDVPILIDPAGLFIGGLPERFIESGDHPRDADAIIHAVRVSTGVRYDCAFQAPERLVSDAHVLSLYDFRDGAEAFEDNDSMRFQGVDWIRL